ncbi:MAG: hypothetical protein PVF85_00110 [Anaerolineales bacterium]|jgi:hypothetical protein
MDFGNLFSSAWNIVWKNKYLILLGILVVLGSAGGGSGTRSTLNNIRDTEMQPVPPFDFHFEAPFQNLDMPGWAAAAAVILVVIAVLIALAVWVLSNVARGGLITGVSTLHAGGESSFSSAFRAGWKKAGRLIGIGLVPAIPGLLLFILTLVSFGFYGGARLITRSDAVNRLPNLAIMAPAVVVICTLVALMLVLSLLRTFANRACMLEDLGVFASYRRGLQVLGNNFGAALVLFILQILLSAAIGLALFLPGILIALCCLLWPLLLVFNGTFAALYSSLWTLAWIEWTTRAEAASTA